MSLTKKIVLAFLLVTVLPLGVIIWVSHRTFVEQAERQVGTRLEDSVVQVGRTIDEFMLSGIRDVKSLEAEPDLSSGDYKLADKRLSSFTYSFPYFDHVILTDIHGMVVASSYGPDVAKSLFALLDNTQDEFELALNSAAGSAYVSGLAYVHDSLHRVVSAGKLTSVDFGVQLLTRVREAGGHTVG